MDGSIFVPFHRVRSLPLLLKMLASRSSSNSGFTLIELAIALFVISIVIGGIIVGTSAVIQSGRTKDAMSIATDLPGAARDFRQRYHFLPGDFPVNNASPEIPGLPAQCMIGGANAGNGNGIIELVESLCVPEHLAKAGYVKPKVDPTTGLVAFSTAFGPVGIIANALSAEAAGPNPLPPTIMNVIEFRLLPCLVAIEMDSQLDDGNLATGKIRGSVAACSPGVLNDPVPSIGLEL